MAHGRKQVTIPSLPAKCLGHSIGVRNEPCSQITAVLAKHESSFCDRKRTIEWWSGHWGADARAAADQSNRRAAAAAREAKVDRVHARGPAFRSPISLHIHRLPA